MTRYLDVVVGPTGVGKSKLALEVASAAHGCIVNADSVQFYSGVQIGANKPTAAELELVRHFLVGWVPVGKTATAADFRREALQVLRGPEIGPRTFLVGGSGFYLQALEKGMFQVGEVPQHILQEVESLAEQGSLVLHQRLQKLDPVAAEKIHSNDIYRVKRALGLVLSEGRTIKQIQEQVSQHADNGFEGFKVKKTGLYLKREELREVVEIRTESMLKQGLIQETEELLQKAPENWAPLDSIGYKEVKQHLKGELSRSDLHAAIVKSTMALAKRQMTWFRRDTGVRWFHAFSEWDQAKDYLLGT